MLAQRPSKLVQAASSQACRSMLQTTLSLCHEAGAFCEANRLGEQVIAWYASHAVRRNGLFSFSRRAASVRSVSHYGVSKSRSLFRPWQAGSVAIEVCEVNPTTGLTQCETQENDCKSSCSRAKPSQALQYGRHFGTLFLCGFAIMAQKASLQSASERKR